MFPSFLSHFVTPHLGKDERKMVSFNVHVDTEAQRPQEKASLQPQKPDTFAQPQLSMLWEAYMLTGPLGGKVVEAAKQVARHAVRVMEQEARPGSSKTRLQQHSKEGSSNGDSNRDSGGGGGGGGAVGSKARKQAGEAGGAAAGAGGEDQACQAGGSGEAAGEVCGGGGGGGGEEIEETAAQAREVARKAAEARQAKQRREAKAEKEAQAVDSNQRLLHRAVTCQVDRFLCRNRAAIAGQYGKKTQDWELPPADHSRFYFPWYDWPLNSTKLEGPLNIHVPQLKMKRRNKNWLPPGHYMMMSCQEPCAELREHSSWRVRHMTTHVVTPKIRKKFPNPFNPNADLSMIFILSSGFEDGIVLNDPNIAKQVSCCSSSNSHSLSFALARDPLRIVQFFFSIIRVSKTSQCLPLLPFPS